MWLQDWLRDWFSHPNMIYYKEAQETRFITRYWTVTTSYIRILYSHYKLLMGFIWNIIYNTAWESYLSQYRISPGHLYHKWQHRTILYSPSLVPSIPTRPWEPIPQRTYVHLCQLQYITYQWPLQEFIPSPKTF